jgi:hypothetical protein
MKRKTKLVIVLLLLLVLIIGVIIFLFLNNKNKEKQTIDYAKGIANTISDSEKLKAYLEEKIDFKYSYAFENCDAIGSEKSNSELKNTFEKTASNIDPETLKEYKNQELAFYLDMFDSSIIDSIEYKDISKSQVYKDLPIVYYYNATYTVKNKNSNEETETKFSLLYYNDQLIQILPTSFIEPNSEGIYDLTNSSNTDKDDSHAEDVPLDLSNKEISEFNKPFDSLEGQKILGSEVKDLIDEVIELNNNYIGDNKRFITITNLTDEDFNNSSLFTTGIDANPYYDGENSSENVKIANEAIEKVKDSINDDEQYSISLIKGREIIVEIVIEN